MRSLMLCVLSLAACAASKPSPAAAQQQPDPEVEAMAAACTPDWGGVPPAAVCEATEDGNWRFTGGQQISQVVAMIDDRTWEAAGPSMLGAVIQLLDPVIRDGTDTPCALQVSRWYRGRAHLALGHLREAFLDFASIIRAGPGHPYYDEVGGAMAILEPHLPKSVVMTCAANYMGPDAIPKPETQDAP